MTGESKPRMSCHVNGNLAKTSTEFIEEPHPCLLFACCEHSTKDRCSTIDRRFSRAIPTIHRLEITWGIPPQLTAWHQQKKTAPDGAAFK